MLKRPPKRVSYQEKEEIIDLPNLIEIQLKSYHEFLQSDRLPHERENVGLEEVFQEVRGWTDREEQIPTDTNESRMERR